MLWVIPLLNIVKFVLLNKKLLRNSRAVIFMGQAVELDGYELWNSKSDVTLLTRVDYTKVEPKLHYYVLDS